MFIRRKVFMILSKVSWYTKFDVKVILLQKNDLKST